jgi:hypothetical protein
MSGIAIGGGLLLTLSLSGSIAYAMSSNTASTTASTTAPVVSPKAALIATGQAIQVAEIDTQPQPAFTAPTGIVLSAPVSYTYSMDININGIGSWRNIMHHGGDDIDRKPALYLTPANKLVVSHATNENWEMSANPSFTPVIDTYFNLTVVCTGGKLIAYINGVKDATGEVTGTFDWQGKHFTAARGTPPPPATWKWSAYKTYFPGNGDPSGRRDNVGPIKVKNVYWFNKGLTDAEVATLATPSTSTTSTFIPEPYNL